MAKPLTIPEHCAPDPGGVSAARNPHELLSRDQIEAEYGLGRRWLELATHRGEGPPMVKISPRMVRYRRCDLDAWIADHVVGNTAAE